MHHPALDADLDLLFGRHCENALDVLLPAAAAYTGLDDDTFDQLRSEIDRIGSTANFNELDLLSGTYAASANALTFQVDLTGDPTQQIQVMIATVSPSSFGIEALAITSTGGARGTLSIRL